MCVYGVCACVCASVCLCVCVCVCVCVYLASIPVETEYIYNHDSVYDGSSVFYSRRPLPYVKNGQQYI